MKITKFRVLSLLTILGCTAAWSGVARSRPSGAASMTGTTSTAQVDPARANPVRVDRSFVQQASALMAADEGIQLLPSNRSETSPSNSVQSFDAPTPGTALGPKLDAKLPVTTVTGNQSSLDRTVRDLSAPPAEPYQGHKPSSLVVNNDGAFSNNGANATLNGSPSSVNSPSGAGPNPSQENSNSNGDSAPNKKRQVVDLRGRIASNANEIRGTAVSSSNQSGGATRTGQQLSPEWVDSAIPKEVFDRANIAPRGSANSAAKSEPIERLQDQSTNASVTSPERESLPTQQPAEVQSQVQAPEIVDASGNPIQQSPDSGNRVPGSSFTPDQAIPQWILLDGRQPGNSSGTTKSNSGVTPPSATPQSAIPPSANPPGQPRNGANNPPPQSKASPTVRDLAPPPRNGVSDPEPTAIEPSPTREIPTRRQMTPEQAIPNWVYDQAGIKPPQDPLPAPKNPTTTDEISKPKQNDPRSILEQNPYAPSDRPIAPSLPLQQLPAQQLPAQTLPSQPLARPGQPASPPSLAEPNSLVPPVGNSTPNANHSGSAGSAGSAAEANASTAKKSYDPVFCLPEDHATAMDEGLCRVGYSSADFGCQGGPQGNTFDACAAAHVYRGKFAITTQRPLVELWRPLYTGGVYPPAKTWFGVTNPMKPHFLVYGDARTAVGFNRNAKGKSNVWGNVLNLDMDLQLTSTERVHAFVSPLNRATKASGLNFNDGVDLIDGTNFNFNTLFFEGDAGALIGGADGRFPPFDLPFTFGLIPLVYQNGIWANDAVLGAAMALPAKNSSLLKWSNFDASIFWATDKVTTDAFPGKDHAADFFGTAWFIDAYEGYIEADYAFVNDNTGNNLGYHNLSLAFTRRYLSRLSNSVRFIVNAGQQDLAKANRTADGNLLLIENSFITAYPNTIVPYFNLFYGQGRPQSLARAGIAGGILNNTGINFETDGITGYPTLDPTGRNTMGFASGVNLLGSQFRHQLVLEFAMLQALGSQQFRNASGNEYGFGVRYQKPLSHNLIFRTDQMVGLRDNATNVTGSRFELRWKF